MNERTQSILNCLINACNHLNVVKIEVAFDGCGDSGNVESVVFLNDEKIIYPEINLSCVFTDNNSEISTISLSLTEAVEEVVYEILDYREGGWEIDEGSYGTFVFDIKKSKIEFEFNARAVTTSTTLMTFNDLLQQQENQE